MNNLNNLNQMLQATAPSSLDSSHKWICETPGEKGGRVYKVLTDDEIQKSQGT